MARSPISLLLAVVLVLGACAATPATSSAPAAPSALPTASATTGSSVIPSPRPSTSATVPALKVARSLDVPGAGPITFGDGSLWVVSKPDWGLTRGPEELKDGVPVGELLQIDEHSGKVVGRAPGAVGGFPAFGAGAVWLCTLAGGLQVVSRVDAQTLAVRRFHASHAEEPESEALVVARGSLWVGNNWAGEIAQVDPSTLKVVHELRVGDGEVTGPRGMAATDGRSVWFPLSSSAEIVRIDASTGDELSRIDLPDGYIDGIEVANGTLYIAAGQGLFLYDVRDSIAQTFVARAPMTWGNAVRYGFGSLWLIRGPRAGTPSDPGPSTGPSELLQLDPESLDVTGRMTLDDATALTIGDEGVWLRQKGKLFEILPT
jgi:hypothetical protein